MTSQGWINSPAERYTYSKHLWMFDIIYESDDGVFTEFEISVDKKMGLKDLLPIINAKIKELTPKSSVDCGFKIYKIRKGEW
jgi:hypothetical protein